jgi:MraZ protein
MALGGMLVLFGIVLACKMRDGSRARAAEETPEPPRIKSEKPATAEPPLAPPLPDLAGKTGPQSGMTPVHMPALPPPVLPTITPAVYEGPPPAPPASETKPGAQPPLGSDPRPILIPASGGSGMASSPPLPPAEEAPDAGKPGPLPAVTPSPLPPATGPATSASSSTSSIPVGPPSVAAPPAAPAPGVAPVKPADLKVTAVEPVKVEVVEHTDAPKSLTPPPPPGHAKRPDEEAVKPLPALRSRMVAKARAVLPLTGTYPVMLDEKRVLTLPPALLAQFGGSQTLLVSPGSDRCLWLTNHAHLDRLAQKLEKSPAREADKAGFKRLYYAQTQKAAVKDGRLAIADKLAAFAGLNQEVVLVGVDDHFEVWDAGRWKRYTEAKKATPTEE